MDPMAYYNDSIFMENFNAYHPGDTSLVCQNNVLLYKDETKVIHNSIMVNENETVSLGMFRVSKMNNNQWQMEPYQLFFYIRESAKFEPLDFNEIENFAFELYNIVQKESISEEEKRKLSYFVDLYNALKSMENILSDKLFIVYTKIKQVFNRIRNSGFNYNNNLINPNSGIAYINTLLFGELKDGYESNSSGDQTSHTRVRGNGHHYTEVTSLNSFNTTESNRNPLKEAAFISVVVLIILLLGIVLGTMTYIFS